MHSPDVLIARVAARQFGVFTFDQAVVCGFTAQTIAYRVKWGRWRRLHRGVYMLIGTDPSFTTHALAATLAAPEAVASFSTAAVLYRVEGFRPGPIEISVPRRRSARLNRATVHRIDLPRCDKTEVSRIPITTPSRTIIDLASDLDADQLEDAVHWFVRKRMVDARKLEERVESMERRGRRGTAKLLKLLRGLTFENVSGSGWENKVRRLLVRSDFKEPVRQFVIADEHGIFVARPDLSYPTHRVYIEYDGAHHMDPKQRARDLERQNQLSALGWRPLVFIDADFKKPPSAIVAKVRRAMRFS
jgi:very-short-patch-repair endonuclease